MDVSKFADIGEVVRRVRKAKGYRLEDLADDNISPATISNIERGHSHVNSKKVHYLVDKLGINMADVPAILTDQKKELDELQFTLSSVDALLTAGNFASAQNLIDQLNLEDSHLFAATLYYLKGKLLTKKGKWKQAERQFNQAICLSDGTEDLTNIEAASFLMLGMGFFYNNELEKALDFTNSGLDAYKEGGEKKNIKPALLSNKALYLSRLGRINEGLIHTQEVWPELDTFYNLTRQAFYSMRANLLRKAGLIDDAISIAEEGAEIARVSLHYQSFFDMWSTLGCLYTVKKNYKKAEQAFEISFSVQGKLESLIPLTDAYIWQGRMYADQKVWEKAFQCVGLAIENAEKIDDASKHAFALRVMGDLYKQQDTKDKAVLHYEKALQIARKYSYKKIEGQLLFRLSQCYKDTNEQEFNRTLRNMYTTQVELQSDGEADYYEEAE